MLIDFITYIWSALFQTIDLMLSISLTLHCVTPLSQEWFIYHLRVYCCVKCFSGLITAECACVLALLQSSFA